MSVCGRGQGGGRLRRIALLGLLLALAVSGLAVAAVQAAPPAASSSLEDQPLTLQYEQPAPEGGTSVIGLVFRLLVSLAVIVAMAWVIIQLFGRQMQRKAQGQWIQVLDEVVLGQNRGIVLAELGGRIWALGVTDHQVSTLFEVEDQSLIQDMMKHRPQDRGGPPPPGLAALLARVRERFAPPPPRGERERRFHSALREQARRLEEMSARPERLRPERRGRDE